MNEKRIVSDIMYLLNMFYGLDHTDRSEEVKNESRAYIRQEIENRSRPLSKSMKSYIRQSLKSRDRYEEVRDMFS